MTAILDEQVLSLLPDAVVVVDAAGRILTVNAQAEALFGYRRSELIGQPVELLLPARLREAHAGERSAYAARPRPRPMYLRRDLTARRKDGSEVPVDIALAPLPAASGLRVLAAVRDATDRVRSTELLRQALGRAEARATEAEALADAAHIVAAGTAAGTTLPTILEALLRVVPASGAFLVLPQEGGAAIEVVAAAGALAATGKRIRSTEGIAGRAFRTGVAQLVEDVRTDPAYVEAVAGIRSELSVPIQSDNAVVGVLDLEDEATGRFRPDDVRVAETFATHAAAALKIDGFLADASSRAAQLVAVNEELQKSNEELERLALYDTLTGLPNRSLLGDRLERAIAYARREGSSLAFVLIDLDGFKDVNDTFGHPVGDRLLQQVGLRLRAELREFDTVARLGGDEFAILLPGATEAVAAKVTTKLLAALGRSFTIDGQTVGLSGSAGIATYPRHGDSVEPLLRCADVAMYAAKGTGGTWAAYAPDLDLHSPGRLAFVAELRQAIDEDSLILHYQPIVSIATGRVTAAEALARWPGAGRDMVLPAEFIPVAERTGLIRPLTERVLAGALRQQAVWRDGGLDLPIAVNVSTRNLGDAGFPDTVERLLAEAGPAAALRLEITESAIMGDPERALAVLTRLRRVGALAEIDDFGTGYSSLAYLQRLPVDAVKVDRSFIGPLSTDTGSFAIVRSIIELCHSLGLAVIAEGVEDRETWDRLAALGCDQVQGHYMSAALPAPQLQRWIIETAFSPQSQKPPGTTPKSRRARGRPR